LRWGRGQPFADFLGGSRRLFVRDESLLYSRKNFSRSAVQLGPQVNENKGEVDINEKLMIFSLVSLFLFAPYSPLLFSGTIFDIQIRRIRDMVENSLLTHTFLL
jgi:hypothetical protein